MSTAARRLLLLAATVLLIGVLVVGWALLRPEEAAAPTQTSPVASPAAALPPADAAAYRRLAPRLAAAAAQARVLVDLGAARERNLLTIRREQGAAEERLAAVDALATAAPPRFAPALDAYAGGARAVRQAMGDAQAGFARFDWDRVAAATGLLERGAAEIERAVGLLDAAAGVPASPAAGTPGAEPAARDTPAQAAFGGLHLDSRSLQG